MNTGEDGIREMKRYYPKSQTLQMGAVVVGVICLLAIRQNMGLGVESGGLALACLLGLGVVAYLASGKRVDVDLASGEVRSNWLLAGVPVRPRRREIDAEGVELRPEWMRSLRVQGGSVKGMQKALVYDLVLVGREKNPTGAVCDTAIDLKEDQVLFTLAERRARVVAEELNLPVSVRWDRLFDDISCETREHGDWGRRFAYPQEMKDWRKWLSW